MAASLYLPTLTHKSCQTVDSHGTINFNIRYIFSLKTSYLSEWVISIWRALWDKAEVFSPVRTWKRPWRGCCRRSSRTRESERWPRGSDGRGPIGLRGGRWRGRSRPRWDRLSSASWRASGATGWRELGSGDDDGVAAAADGVDVVVDGGCWLNARFGSWWCLPRSFPPVLSYHNSFRWCHQMGKRLHPRGTRPEAAKDEVGKAS